MSQDEQDPAEGAAAAEPATNETADSAPTLRQRAEARLQGLGVEAADGLENWLPAAGRRALHELRVHQIELEMQNEELRQAQLVLDALRARYFDLYKLAPAGYCSVSAKGLVVEANLPLAIALTATDNDMLQVSVPARDGTPGAMIWLVTFRDRADVEIKRGENEGKHMAYTQIVTGRQVLGMWDPKAGAQLTLPLSQVLTGASNGAAILVQEERNGLPGPILGAASFTR